MSELSNHVKMGFEGQLFIGAAGSTATTPVLNFRNLKYSSKLTKGETTIRGDGSAVPQKTESATKIENSIEFEMINDNTDSTLQTMLAAAMSGAGIALRTKDRAAGKGFNGDVVLEVEHDETDDKEQTYKFTAVPTRDYSRAPLGYV